MAVVLVEPPDLPVKANPCFTSLLPPAPASSIEVSEQNIHSVCINAHFLYKKNVADIKVHTNDSEQPIQLLIPNQTLAILIFFGKATCGKELA